MSEISFEVVAELVEFVNSFNPEARIIATQHLFGLTGSIEYLPLMRGNPKIIDSLVKLIKYDPIDKLRHVAYSALVNLSGDLIIVDEMFQSNTIHKFIEFLISNILDQKSYYAEPSCIILANISRHEAAAAQLTKMTCGDVRIEFEKIQKLVQGLYQSAGDGNGDEAAHKGRADISESNYLDPEEDGELIIYSLLKAFTNIKYNKKGQHLHFLACYFENLTQLEAGRELILNKDKFTFQKLLCFVTHDQPIRRGGIIGLIKNCLFDSDYHEYLLSPDVNLLPVLLYPLAGGEEYTEKEMENMCDELLYLPADKTREPDMGFRQMLVEALMQLCNTKYGREFLRDHKAYPILRSLHTFEENGALEYDVYNLVQILIGDETGENFKKVVIPKDLKMNPDQEEVMKIESLFNETVNVSFMNNNNIIE